MRNLRCEVCKRNVHVQIPYSESQVFSQTRGLLGPRGMFGVLVWVPVGTALSNSNIGRFQKLHPRCLEACVGFSSTVVEIL